MVEGAREIVEIFGNVNSVCQVYDGADYRQPQEIEGGYKVDAAVKSCG